MAYIHQYSDRGDKKIIRQMGILFCIGIVFAGFMITTSENIKNEWEIILGTALFMVVLFMVISYKSNPLAWIKLFRKSKFDRIILSTGEITEELRKLDDRCFVFTWLIMEFFRIDHLVITPHGIFAIAGMQNTLLSPTDKNRESGMYSPSWDKLTAKLWRICHMISILFKKGFKIDVMPIPIIVPIGGDDTALINKLKDIHVVPKGRLTQFIIDQGEVLDIKVVEGFARFVSRRYLPKL